MKRTSVECSPSEVAVKSFFLGPNAENGRWLNECIQKMFAEWFEWRRAYSRPDGILISETDQKLQSFREQIQFTEDLLLSLGNRFKQELPKFSPRYIGHMFSEVSMPAFLGHILTLMHNPNNISPEASRVGVEIEKEAIQLLAQEMGLVHGVGHFTSGGTLANFEFILRARERVALWLAAGLLEGGTDPIRDAHMGWKCYKAIEKRWGTPAIYEHSYLNDFYLNFKKIAEHYQTDFAGPVLIVPHSKHYSWPKAAHFFGIGEKNIWYIDLDPHGRACPESLMNLLEKARIHRRPILGVVAIAGTTEMGTIDPIHRFTEILANYRQKYGMNIWFHIDGAYGGFFRTLLREGYGQGAMTHASLEDLEFISQCDSITLDPHKLGYVPYSSGVFLAREANDYFIRSFTGPYLVSDPSTLGNYTIEGSRSAAGAVATWLSMKTLEKSSGYARVLRRSLLAKKLLQEKLANLNCRVFMPESLDSNIICFAVYRDFKKLSLLNQHSLKIYNYFKEEKEYWISKTLLDGKCFGKVIQGFCEKEGLEMDSYELCLLRITIMNPFFISKESRTSHIQNFVELLQNYSDRAARPPTL